MSETTREMAEAAAEWWARAISSPKFDNLGPTRGRDPEETRVNDRASILATMVAAQEAPGDGAIDRFRSALANKIESGEEGCIGVDYGPDQILADAALEAGVSGRVFPWKTTMWIRDGKVTVRHGYGAPEETIYPKEVAP